MFKAIIFGILATMMFVGTASAQMRHGYRWDPYHRVWVAPPVVVAPQPYVVAPPVVVAPQPYYVPQQHCDTILFVTHCY